MIYLILIGAWKNWGISWGQVAGKFRAELQKEDEEFDASMLGWRFTKDLLRGPNIIEFHHPILSFLGIVNDFHVFSRSGTLDSLGHQEMRALFWRPGQAKKPDAVTAPRVLVAASEGTESRGLLKNGDVTHKDWDFSKKKG